MKKLLVLILVLGMASLASAVTLDLVDNGDGTYSIDVLSPGISGAVDGTGIYWVLLGADTAGLPSTANIAANVLLNMSLSGAQGDAGDTGLFDYGLGLYGEFRATNTTYNLAAGTFASGFTAMEGATEIELLTMDDGFGAATHIETIIIPEPATIALLCLGGLLLRKK